VKLNYIFIL